MFRDNPNKYTCLTEYARSYIKYQPYENLLSVEDAFKKGTIFKNLDMPYKENSKLSNCNKRYIND